MIYGYAKVSTTAQSRDGNSLEDQVAALQKYGCHKIIEEAFSGKTMDRPKFQKLLETLREGDPSQTTLIWWEVFCFAMLNLSKRIGWNYT